MQTETRNGDLPLIAEATGLSLIYEAGKCEATKKPGGKLSEEPAGRTKGAVQG